MASETSSSGAAADRADIAGQDHNTHMAQTDSKTYAEAVSGEAQTDALSSDGSQRASEYTEDEYTDDYTESIFSDSNYSGNSSEAETEDAGRRQESEKNSRPWPAMEEAGGGSPGEAAAALAPAHRFVSHTPWGAAAGRLTRGQRDRRQLWAEPQTAADAQAASTAASGDQVVNVVSLAQGSRGYTQLQQQMQQTQKLLRQESRPAEGGGVARIVTVAQFLGSLSRLVGIGFPGVRSTESLLAAALVGVLGLRTALDVWFARFNARCVRAVVSYDRRTLVRLLGEYIGMAVPMAAVNQAIKWVMSSLTIALRVRLGRYAHARYVEGVTNITWSQRNRQGAATSERPDWLVTVQLHRFADMLPRLVADVVKPAVDWVVFSRLLSRVIGRTGSLAMVAYVVVANVVIRMTSPPAGMHAARLAALEDAYRGVCGGISSTIQRAVAGTPLAAEGQAEGQAFVPRVQSDFRRRARAALDGSLDAVAGGVVGTNMRRFWGGIGESVLAKYGATLTAYCLLARPVCSPGRRLASEIMHDPAAVMMSYSRNSAYLINLAQATTRLLLMVGDLPKFAWSTVRVDRLLRSLDVHARYGSAADAASESAE